MVCGELVLGLHFCNPQTDGRVVGGGGMGYISVTRNEACVLSWVGWGCMGYIFVTRDEECVIVVVRRWMCGLHFCNPQ